MQRRPVQFAATQIADVVGDDGDCPARDSQFDQVVVAFVAQIGTPSVVDLYPVSCSSQCGQKNLSFGMVRLCVQNLATEYVFVFQPQSIAEEGAVAPLQATTQHFAGCATFGAQCGDKYAGIQHDVDHG